LTQTGSRKVEKDSLIDATEEAFAQCWRTPIA